MSARFVVNVTLWETDPEDEDHDDDLLEEETLREFGSETEARMFLLQTQQAAAGWP